MESETEILQVLDMKSKAQLLMATREDLEKCKSKNSELSDAKINELYSKYAESIGFSIQNWWEEVISGIENIKKYRTGIDAIDKCLKKGAELCSDELVEIVGPSSGGKTTLALKIAALALIENDADVIYIDTSNYCNDANISALLSQVMTGYDIDSASEKLKSLMNNIKVFSIYTLEELIVFLSTVISLITSKSPKFDKPNLIVIDSLSAMVANVAQKAQGSVYLKEVLTLIKRLNKNHYWMVLFTNNAYEGATKISELSRLVTEPIVIGVDKSIYWWRQDGTINYIVIHS